MSVLDLFAPIKGVMIFFKFGFILTLQNLVCQRDMLFPRLMSRKVEVKS